MQPIPLDVLVAAYPVEQGAEAALQNLAKARHAGSIRIRAAVTLRKDASNDLHLVDAAPGALLGGIGGVVIGVVAGPMGWDKLGGPRIGELAAKLQDGDFLDELRHLGRRLPAGWSAIVTVVEHHGLWHAKRSIRENGIAPAGATVADTAVEALR